MSSTFKNKIVIQFNSNDKDLANNIHSMFLDLLSDNNIELKGLRTYVDVQKADLNSKGNELLDELGIKVSDIRKNKDILEAENLSAILVSKPK